jgi:uncharacterized protein
MIKTLICFQLMLLFICSVYQAANAGQINVGQSLSLVSQNMNRFFDDKDDGLHEKVVSHKTYQKRIKKLSEKILINFAKPDIIALQEVENLDILLDVAKALKKKGMDYQAVLMEGNDVSGIDVGFLVKKPYRVTQKKQLFKNLHFGNSESFLFSRPPLLIKACISECITISNIHLRSMRGLRNNKKARRVAMKRKLQAETLANWVNKFQNANPQQRLILVGDFNALPVSDKFVDVVGIIRGNPDTARPKLKSYDLIKRDLIDLTRSVPAEKRYSFLYKKHKQQLDYLLISNSKNYKLKNLEFSRLDFKFSDHAALISNFELTAIRQNP